MLPQQEGPWAWDHTSPTGAACSAEGPGLVRGSGTGTGSPQAPLPGPLPSPPPLGSPLSRAGLCSRGTGGAGRRQAFLLQGLPYRGFLQAVVKTLSGCILYWSEVGRGPGIDSMQPVSETADPPWGPNDAELFSVLLMFPVREILKNAIFACHFRDFLDLFSPSRPRPSLLIKGRWGA